MASSNLPPGVSESDIPGNRPEDEWQDKFFEAVEIPLSLYLAVDPTELGEDVSQILEYLDKARAAGYADGYSEGKCES